LFITKVAEQLEGPRAHVHQNTFDILFSFLGHVLVSVTHIL
jgi:hypothetical protein